MSDESKHKFNEVTSTNINKEIGIILIDELVLTTVVQARIDSGIIYFGDFKSEESAIHFLKRKLGENYDEQIAFTEREDIDGSSSFRSFMSTIDNELNTMNFEVVDSLLNYFETRIDKDSQDNELLLYYGLWLNLKQGKFETAEVYRKQFSGWFIEHSEPSNIEEFNIYI